MTPRQYAAKEKDMSKATNSTTLYHFFHLPIWVANNMIIVVPMCPGSRKTELKRGIRIFHNSRSSNKKKKKLVYE